MADEPEPKKRMSNPSLLESDKKATKGTCVYGGEDRSEESYGVINECLSSS